MTVLSIQSGKKNDMLLKLHLFYLKMSQAAYYLFFFLFFCFLTEHSLNDHNNLKGTSHLMISALSLVNLCTFRAKIIIMQCFYWSSLPEIR